MLMLNEYVVVPTKKEVEKNGARCRDKDGRITRTRYNYNYNMFAVAVCNGIVRNRK